MGVGIGFSGRGFVRLGEVSSGPELDADPVSFVVVVGSVLLWLVFWQCWTAFRARRSPPRR